jgi:CheY-like chemotaxis protein
VHTDLTKVRQSLFNVLSNAAKFTENGRITLSARRERNGADMIVLEVKDTGIGMTPEQLARVFEPFAQADASTSRRFGGTGLGMAITREFCAMLGGDVACDSEVGKGTTFTLRFRADMRPRPQTVEEGAAEAADEQVPANAPLVLVVDDDSNVRNLLQRNLNGAGYRVCLAASGDEGLKRAKELKPDAITLDVMMPSKDGWAVLSELKADPETADIPVIMVTIVEDRQLGFSLGASEYLSKPVDRARLLEVLRRFLRDKEKGTVLLVEDDGEVRRVFRNILEREGVRLIEAENGRIGLDKLAEDRPDLILLDLMMPEMDGFEFVEHYRDNPAWHDIPIVVVTAKTLTDEDRARLNGWVGNLLHKADANIEAVLADLGRRLRARRA